MGLLYECWGPLRSVKVPCFQHSARHLHACLRRPAAVSCASMYPGFSKGPPAQATQLGLRFSRCSVDFPFLLPPRCLWLVLLLSFRWDSGPRAQEADPPVSYLTSNRSKVPSSFTCVCAYTTELMSHLVRDTPEALQPL